MLYCIRLRRSIRYIHGGDFLKTPRYFLCPLVDANIDPDLCLEVQDCIEGITEVTLIMEDYLEKDDHEDICKNCRYHL